MKRDYIAVTQF